MIQRILVPVEGSPMAEQALGQAAAMASAFDAEILLLRVQRGRAARRDGYRRRAGGYRSW